MSDVETYQEAAARYMAHKGYPDIEPVESDRINDIDNCWYFEYELPEGVLELEVEFVDGEWKFFSYMD